MSSSRVISVQESELEINEWGMDSITEIRLGDSRKAFVIDGVFDSQVSGLLYDNYSRLKYSFEDIDRDDTGHVKHLVRYLEQAEIDDPKGAGSIVSLVYHFLDGFKMKHAGAVSRAYLNFNLFGDFQFAHVDGDEWTALFFIADEWSEDWMGEFLLIDPTTNVKFAVTPKPGRLVLFDGEILHRGGVPSKLCLKPRITLAVKIKR